jgi:hypothetical protein
MSSCDKELLSNSIYRWQFRATPSLGSPIDVTGITLCAQRTSRADLALPMTNAFDEQVRRAATARPACEDAAEQFGQRFTGMSPPFRWPPVW